jgi:hypothetical protein
VSACSAVCVATSSVRSRSVVADSTAWIHARSSRPGTPGPIQTSSPSTNGAVLVTVRTVCPAALSAETAV